MLQRAGRYREGVWARGKRKEWEWMTGREGMCCGAANEIKGRKWHQGLVAWGERPNNCKIQCGSGDWHWSERHHTPLASTSALSSIGSII